MRYFLGGAAARPGSGSTNSPRVRFYHCTSFLVREGGSALCVRRHAPTSAGEDGISRLHPVRYCACQRWGEGRGRGGVARDVHTDRGPSPDGSSRSQTSCVKPEINYSSRMTAEKQALDADEVYFAGPLGEFGPSPQVANLHTASLELHISSYLSQRLLITSKGGLILWLL